MSNEDFQTQDGKIFTKSFFVLLLLSVIGLFLIGVRIVKGLGAVTNMSDGFPWGIWITYDVATGTAIACGGYAVAILVYIRNHMHYHPLIRSCVLTSMFGYGLAGFSVMVDLGRPWNSYNFFVPWNWQVNSAMFEVALCVMAYSTVLIIEFLPAILITIENTRWQNVRNILAWLHPRLAPNKAEITNNMEWARTLAAWIRPKLDKVLIFFIALGITLPTMHQSSLGSLLLIASTKLHPLWHTPFLPLLFLINCIYIGFAIAILESIFSSHAFKRPFEINELSGLGRVVRWLPLAWLAVVFGDYAHRGQLGAAFRLDFYSLFFLLQAGLLGAGALILFSKAKRHSPRWLFISASLIVLGGGLYRFNVYLIGFNPGQGWIYFPSLSEILITVGIVSIELLGYQVLVKLFPVLPKVSLHGHGKPHIKHQPPARAAGTHVAYGDI
jgi:Ni/Fe-hydrogenase subunit HybB-like protein